MTYFIVKYTIVPVHKHGPNEYKLMYVLIVTLSGMLI